MKIAILGCGPAGLLVAEAAAQLGHDIAIFSKKRKSEMYGAQYLHAEIPGIPLAEPNLVTYTLHGGTSTDYRRKVYGHEYAGQVSPDVLGEPHKAWDIREMYSKLWVSYSDLVTSYEFESHNRASLAKIMDQADLVVNSIPRPVLCVNPTHQFPAQKVWAIGDAPERGIFAPKTAPPFSVVCNASKDTGWYRASNIYGYRTVEWATKHKPPFEGVAEIQKPLLTDCDCWPEIKHVGRFGKWQKGVLSHTAYFDTLSYLEELQA